MQSEQLHQGSDYYIWWIRERRTGTYLAVGQSCTFGVSFDIAQGAGAGLGKDLTFTDAISGISQSLTLNGDAGTSENAPTVSEGVSVGNVAWVGI